MHADSYPAADGRPDRGKKRPAAGVPPLSKNRPGEGASESDDDDDAYLVQVQPSPAAPSSPSVAAAVLFDEPNSQPPPSMTPEQWSAKPDGAASKARIEATDGAALKARIEATLSPEALQALESLKATCKKMDRYKIQVALN